jgi:DNA-binding NarL/FixJ family response regulator
MDVSELTSRESRRRPGGVLVALTAPLMQAAAQEYLQEHGFAVHGTAADAAGVIDRVLRGPPDAVLIDTDLPGGGVVAAEGVLAAAPNTAVVMMAEGPTKADVVDAVRAGAVGCLSKGISLEGLARAVSGVLSGEAALPRALVAAALEEVAISDARLVYGSVREGTWDFTVRELEVLRLLAQRASTAEIARELSISPTTVRRHCAAICRKLNVPDRAAAVELVKRSQLPLASQSR